jgi:hypothetical protein
MDSEIQLQLLVSIPVLSQRLMCERLNLFSCTHGSRSQPVLCSTSIVHSGNTVSKFQVIMPHLCPPSREEG